MTRAVGAGRWEGDVGLPLFLPGRRRAIEQWGASHDEAVQEALPRDPPIQRTFP